MHPTNKKIPLRSHPLCGLCVSLTTKYNAPYLTILSIICLHRKKSLPLHRKRRKTAQPLSKFAL